MARDCCSASSASVSKGAQLASGSDDKQRSVSAPDGHLLAAKSERVRLPNTSPNFRARALREGTLAMWRGSSEAGESSFGASRRGQPRR